MPNLHRRQNGARPNLQEKRLVRDIDRLAEYEDYYESFLPILRKMLKKGMTREQIEKDERLAPLLLAKQIKIALTDPDSAKNLAALKDLRDRMEGRPLERKEVRAKIEEASDDAINARLKTLLKGRPFEEALEE